jgi:hypothetical protein
MPEATARRVILVAAAVLLALAAPRARAAGLSAEMKAHLAESEYVYVSSQRKDGTFSPPAEIWFFVHDGAVWVGTKRSSWRVRRILAGRPAAKVHAYMPSGPSFEATASLVADKEVWKRMFAAYEKKYAAGWKTHGKIFAEGAADGSYVLVRYTPK